MNQNHDNLPPLPEPLPPHTWGGEYPSRDSFAEGRVDGWNDCLDAVRAALAAQPSREVVAEPDDPLWEDEVLELAREFGSCSYEIGGRMDCVRFTTDKLLAFVAALTTTPQPEALAPEAATPEKAERGEQGLRDALEAVRSDFQWPALMSDTREAVESALNAAPPTQPAQARVTELEQALQSVQREFRRYGNSFPDGFDSRVFRWVDDALSGVCTQRDTPPAQADEVDWSAVDAALFDVDDWVNRVNGDDRGTSVIVNTLRQSISGVRAALTQRHAAPLATDAELMKLADEYANARCAVGQLGTFGTSQKIGDADRLAQVARQKLANALAAHPAAVEVQRPAQGEAGVPAPTGLWAMRLFDLIEPHLSHECEDEKRAELLAGIARFLRSAIAAPRAPEGDRTATQAGKEQA